MRKRGYPLKAIVSKAIGCGRNGAFGVRLVENGGPGLKHGKSFHSDRGTVHIVCTRFSTGWTGNKIPAGKPFEAPSKRGTSQDKPARRMKGHSGNRGSRIRQRIQAKKMVRGLF